MKRLFVIILLATLFSCGKHHSKIEIFEEPKLRNWTEYHFNKDISLIRKRRIEKKIRNISGIECAYSDKYRFSLIHKSPMFAWSGITPQIHNILIHLMPCDTLFIDGKMRKPTERVQ